jgi:hypothetical protein
VADILVTATTDSDEWSLGIDHLAIIIYEYTADASLDAAEYIGSLTRGKLSERAHGPLSFSPSSAGEPPAMVFGDLLASITAARSGGTSAMVGPTGGFGRTEFYARIQELGGEMHGDPVMEFLKMFDGGIRKMKLEYVELFPRPYLRPATEDAVNSGRVRDIYARWWADAIEAGAG